MIEDKSNSQKNLSAATSKTLSRKRDLIIKYSKNQKDNFFTWNQNIILATSNQILLPEISRDLNSLRAASDLGFLYLAHHNSSVHSHFKFDSESQQKIFDEFEKIRVILNNDRTYLGVTKNILDQIERDIKTDSDSDDPNLFLALSLLLKALPQGYEKITNAVVKLKSDPALVASLIPLIQHQEKFGEEVKKIIEALNKPADNPEKQPSKFLEELDEDPASPAAANKAPGSSKTTELGQARSPQNKLKNETVQTAAEANSSGPDSVPDSLKPNDELKIESRGRSYRVFTTEYDEVIKHPKQLTTEFEIAALRDQLDLRLLKLKAVSKRLAIKLKRKLLAKKALPQEYDSNEGILNRRKYPQLIINPLLPNLHISSRYQPQQDTIVSILLDNSGSMRGSPILMAALASEVIASILERFAIKTEIIGFTTVDWKGGRSRKAWESAGKPKNPGRLNDLRHIIYKSANQSLKKAKINLGLMLKEGILKENIDGEALLFARSRIASRLEGRKIIMVISDGTPVDDSTNSTNGGAILVDHLQHVIKKIERESKIEIVGIGIGHHVQDFYHNSIMIKLADELGDAMINKIADLVAVR